MLTCSRLFATFLLSFFLSNPLFAERSEVTLAPERHSDMRFSTDFGYQEGLGAFIAPEYRFALHDLLDRKGDYPHSTAMEVVAFKWRVHVDDPKPWLDRLTMLRVLRIPNFSQNGGEWSWSVDVGLRTVRDPICNHCLAGNVQGGLGITEQPFRWLPLEFFLLAEAGASLAPDAFDGFFQPSVGPRVGTRFWWTDNLSLLVDARYYFYFLANTPSAFQAHGALRYYLGWDMAIEGRIAKFPDGWESAAGLYVYF